MTHGLPPPELLGIGELSRLSGLTPSALRFYDTHGVLPPAHVDPVTGYRRYTPDQADAARLLAGMRRIQMPLAEMAAVLESMARQELDAACEMLTAHLDRLRHGLQDACRETDRLQALIAGPPPVELSLPVAALHRALDDVRWAAGADPQFPVLTSILLDRDEDGVRLIATDRYRLAVATVPGAPVGPTVQMVLPLPLVDAVRAARQLPEHATIQLQHRDGKVTASSDTRTIVQEPEVAGDYPDVHRLLQSSAGLVELDAAQVRHDLGQLPGDLTRVFLDAEGVAPASDARPPDAAVQVDRGFLLDALHAVGDGVVCLPLDGPIGPLVVHDANGSLVSLVMPMRHKSDAEHR